MGIRRSRGSSRGAAAPTYYSGGGYSGHHPGLLVAVGLLFLIVFVIGLMTQIETNEAFITHAGAVNVYQPDWGVFMQLPNLIGGTTSSSAEAAAAMFGWGIELIYLGFIVGYELVQNAVWRSGRVMAGIFRTLSWGIVIFNGWTDFHYGTFGTGWGGHLAFALITSFIVGYFGTVGWGLVEQGWMAS